MLRLLKGMALAGALALAPGGAKAEWLQAKSQHFTIYSEGSEAKLRDFAQKLEKFDALLRRVTEIDDPEIGSPVHVYLVANEAKVRQLARNRNAAGYYDTSDRFAYAVLPRSARNGEYDLGAEEILFHEYTHHFMLHHFPAAYPAWYVEGFAEFFSEIKFRQDGMILFGNIPRYRAPGLVLGTPYPLEKLLARNTQGLGVIDGDRYYGTAWLLTHFYQYGASRREEISRYLKDVARGVPDMNLDSYFKGGVRGLDKDLYSYMKKGLRSSGVDSKDMKIGAITVSAVEGVRGALIEDELRMFRSVRTEEVPELLNSVRQTAARFPDNAYALAILAEAEMYAEQGNAALADADRAIALDPGLSRAHSTRAMILLDRAQESGKDEDWASARAAIIRANRADIEDPVPLALFYRFHKLKGGPMPQVGYDGFTKAFNLLPQNPNYRFGMAVVQADRGEFASASRLLDPLAYSPHASGAREEAIRMKADYDAKAKAAGKDKVATVQ